MSNTVRICKECGKEFLVDKTHRVICKDCYNRKRRENYRNENIKKFEADGSLKIHRKYKNVRQERILNIKELGINPISTDEVFVALIDYKDSWISNHGRVLSKYGNKYSLMRKKHTDNGEIAYQMNRNVYMDGKYTYEKRLVEAWRLVVGEFIINYDIANNNKCWHKSNNKDDLYYRNIYPLNEKEYAAVEEVFRNDGIDTEERIYEVMNDVKYRPDGWNPTKMKRTMCGIGYLGMGENTNIDNHICKTWRNIMMERCYSDAVHKTRSYYKGCSVCEEWWNYANFELWYKNNMLDGRKRDLDKDILIQGNSEYAPDTCALVSHYMNTIFAARRGFDTNIILNDKTGKYDTFVVLLRKRLEVGSFDTEEEAKENLFSYKKDYISKFAKKCKNKVPDKVYFAMQNWDVAMGY